MFNFLNNSFKAVTYGKTILQTNYDVMIVLAQKKHSGIIYQILALKQISWWIYIKRPLIKCTYGNVCIDTIKNILVQFKYDFNYACLIKNK